MKKQFFMIGAAVLFVTGSLIFSSCGNSGNKEKSETKDNTEMVKQEAVKADTAAVDSDAVTETKYQCSMKCEGDKTYDKPGKCPKCGMNLVAVNGEEGHEGHASDSVHK